MSKTVKTEFVAFSDFHAHNFKFGATRVLHNSAWLNSRLVDCLHVLKEIRDYCLTHNIDTLLFGGDLFHRRSIIHTDVFNAVFTEIEDLGDMEIVMIPGNHDYADRSGTIHSLDVFQSLPSVTVLDCVSVHNTRSGLTVVGVPYTDDPFKAQGSLKQAAFEVDGILAKPGFKVLLAHLGMQGAKVGSDYVMLAPSDIEVADVPHDKFDLCLFGHYHQHQRLFENGWFIGATHHHNWGDANTKRGFLHVTVYDDNTFDFKQIETSAPRFLKLDKDNVGELAPRPQDFSRYYAKDGEEEPVFAGSTVVEIIQEPTEISSTNLTMSDQYLNPHSIVDSWVDSFGEGSQDLKDLGKKLLAEAEGQEL